jgi:hypothetical protein
MKKKAAPISSLPLSRGPRKRYLEATEQRTKKDWALFMQEVFEEHYSEVSKEALTSDISSLVD